ncbi:SDR family NAD(P)-dependent oxidoreductase [Segniliparus rugosus]|uniref:Ketoreductase domain-containing protein n=1 Tax=Segniliparus rugosus (strain ATCC BAA-974 / DSM 45345 / CCUG 50838 / CIP 108380 / JCM 13579 / CDC 945) TaxID=679197 RepID=E5XUB8_SEGRC|nr:SDR family NAD(P)-dependent oxidoreductase [Segniliparus rugosus]EFV12059.1 hypothetical protein HMPREF9336_03090 [Segniliparus rugosus ATCC BAA-974]
MGKEKSLLGAAVLVTGAGSGIGRATARAFAARGAKVVATDRDFETVRQTEELVRAEGGFCEAAALDVTDPAAWERVLKEVQAQHGLPRVLVNNAGYTTAGPFLDHSAAEWSALVAVNVRGVVTGSRLYARQLVDAGSPGQIINVASAAAYVPVTASSPYCTTKAAVMMFSESLRLELRRHGIGVTAICPGAINTGFYTAARHLGSDAAVNATRQDLSANAIAKFGSGPEAVAKAIVRSVSTNRAVQPVTAEAYLGYALWRLSPTVMRVVARLSGEGTLRQFERTALPQKVLGWLKKEGSK